MLSVEIAESGRLADVHFFSSKEKRLWRKFPMLRIAMAISASIARAFPEEVKEVGVTQVLKTQRALAPLMIALNEMADLGISARLKRQSGCRQSQFLPLLQLESGLRRFLNKREDEFLERSNCGESGLKVIAATTNDLLLLSESRSSFSPGNFPQYLELDSLIYEFGCLGLAIPRKVEELGIAYCGGACRTVDQLVDKYSPVLIFGRNKSQILSRQGAARIFTGLHAVEMILKVGDDMIGGGQQDALLGLPNFCLYADYVVSQQKGEYCCANRKQVLRKMVEDYESIATSLGVPAVLIMAGRLLCTHSTNSRARECWSGTPVVEDLGSVSRFTDFGQSICLRERLDGSSILSRLFSG